VSERERERERAKRDTLHERAFGEQPVADMTTEKGCFTMKVNLKCICFGMDGRIWISRDPKHELWSNCRKLKEK
jgi:hypothetical protein